MEKIGYNVTTTDARNGYIQTKNLFTLLTRFISIVKNYMAQLTLRYLVRKKVIFTSALGVDYHKIKRKFYSRDSSINYYHRKNKLDKKFKNQIKKQESDQDCLLPLP